LNVDNGKHLKKFLKISSDETNGCTLSYTSFLYSDFSYSTHLAVPISECGDSHLIEKKKKITARVNARFIDAVKVKDTDLLDRRCTQTAESVRNRNRDV